MKYKRINNLQKKAGPSTTLLYKFTEVCLNKLNTEKNIVTQNKVKKLTILLIT